MTAYSLSFDIAPGLLSSRGMGLLTVVIGAGAFALSRVFRTRRPSFPAVAAAPLQAVATPEDSRPRVVGRASSERLVTSPLTQTLCCYYYAEIEQDLPVPDLLPSSDAYSGSGGWNWSNIHTAVSTADFLLQDAQGMVRVCPAILDVREVPVTFEYQVPEHDRSEKDQVLVDYVAKNCPDKLKIGFANLVQAAFVSEEQAADFTYQQKMQEWRRRRERVFQRKTRGQRFRFRERCILPGGEYAIAGMVQAGTSGERQLIGSAERVTARARGDRK